ncbi:glycoside hydrolase family 65 protein [Opitutaceae bacterium LMO-CP1]|nr:glycoside hydrolase family 65 protein [Opitutaceae bacterium LMO-M01]
MRRGNIYQLANGYMGYRGTLDEYGTAQCVGITLAGLYDRVGSAWREPVNAPNGGYTALSVDGVDLTTLDEANAVAHEQSVNMAEAVFERRTRFVVGGHTIVLHTSRFLSADERHLGVVRVSITSDADTTLQVCTGIDGRIWDINGPHLPQLTAETRDGALLVHGCTQENQKRVAVVECVEAPFTDVKIETEAPSALRVVSLPMAAGETVTFTKYFAVVTENDASADDVIGHALAVVEQAHRDGYDACRERHVAAWTQKWMRSDVVIEGDDEAQRALRYSIFQLLMAAPWPGSGLSIPARALSGQVYKGAVFWDTEMFMFPFFLHTHPEAATELLRYRVRTLDGARRKARTEGPGYRGAFYAWESQETGDDACSYFNVGDPTTGRDLRTHFRDKQVHISGDVAIAIWAHFRHTGDDSLLLEGGAEVILECARFYDSYAYFKRDKNRFEILDVIGPDEYHERVNNNAFTSQVARETILIALATVEHLSETHPAALEALLAKLDIAGELQGLAELARNLFVPEPHPETGVIEQFEGYFKLDETSIDALKERRVHPNEYLGAGQGLAVPTQIIKQADVVMMLNLFKDRYDDRVRRANWEFYEPRTEHGSSLSACAYAMVAAEFGNLDYAYRYFLKTAKIDLDGAYKVYAGTVFIGGSHPAANGGAWMTAVFGFGGVRTDGEGLHIRPRLYREWQRLAFSLCYRGDRFAVEITPTLVSITADSDNARFHEVDIAGQVRTCPPGTTVTVPLPEPQPL